MKLFILLFFLLVLTPSFSQIKIDGVVKDTIGNPISEANVIISEIETDHILAYSITNNQGLFSISYKTDTIDLKKVSITVTSMGFKKVYKLLDNVSQKSNFILQDEITELKEVVLKHLPISKRGDTINYAVSDFTKQNDRTLADVIKNMPALKSWITEKYCTKANP